MQLLRSKVSQIYFKGTINSTNKKSKQNGFSAPPAPAADLLCGGARRHGGSRQGDKVAVKYFL